MLSRNAVDEVKKRTHTNQTELAKLAGMTGQSTVSEYLKRDMKVSVFVRLINALGYEVIIREKKRGRREKDDTVLLITDGIEVTSEAVL